MSCIIKLKLNDMDVYNASINRYLNMEVEDFNFFNIMENLTMSRDKAS